MAVSRSAKIATLLVIDVIFFFVELIVGYAVGSLALVADSFHMLNDVLSLVVALYAIKLTAKNEADSRYSYGWHRAEILAALVNGVFLLALCFSIFLEALERFFSTPEISNPKLVVIVGCLGLASNIVGLFLFHEHGHSHGHDHSDDTPNTPTMENTHLSIHGSGDDTPKPRVRSPSPSRSHGRSGSYSSLYGHPAATRAQLVQTAQDLGAFARSPSPPARGEAPRRLSVDGNVRSPPINIATERLEETYEEQSTESTPLIDDAHRLVPPKSSTHSQPNSHSHGHGSMNMRALVLHVLGDALGNVGVIATGLIIWLAEWRYKYYFDPVISLVITVIIFSSAMPLVRSASFILLQGVPSNVSLEAVREAILNVDGVLDLHDLHIWQLSETKVIASVHVHASRKHDFMPVAAGIREILHYHGIHSSTIQPEYPDMTSSGEHIPPPEGSSCLIACPPNQQCSPQENGCCPPPPAVV